MHSKTSKIATILCLCSYVSFFSYFSSSRFVVMFPIEGFFFVCVCIISDQFNRHRSRLPLNQAELLISNKLSREAIRWRN